MIAQRTLALISYNDSNKDHLSRDYALANQLANYLQRNGIDAEIRGYSTSILNIGAPQWLILIPSPEIVKSPQMNKVVDTALDQVVKRRMKGVLAVTASTSDLPSKWATIRKYDASDPREENVALAGVLRAMKYAKVTYLEAKAQAQSQQKQQAAVSLAPWPQKKLVPALIGIMSIVGLLVLANISLRTNNHSTPGHALSSLNLTATSQALTHVTPTALANTAQTSPTATQAFIQARQKEYVSITSMQPRIKGFQTNDQWSSIKNGTTSCTLGNSTYDASIQTTNQYMRCMAANTKFTNFALQVMMTINGDAGGVIFRDNGNGTYYRLAFNQSDSTPAGIDTFSVYLCKNGVCDTRNADIGMVSTGTLLTHPDTKVNTAWDIPIPFTLIVQDGNIDLYINNKFKIRVIDNTFKKSTSLSSRIGVYAASLVKPTDVTFSGLKVWSLD